MESMCIDILDMPSHNLLRHVPRCLDFIAESRSPCYCACCGVAPLPARDPHPAPSLSLQTWLRAAAFSCTVFTDSQEAQP